ncbi:bifunctional phosphoribosyl-AMP cyclohydrolase/phosphoribosyl-ATP diphosphatase HisIE [Butyrivibrio sp. MC2021]|uniref:bifunctional phosphoribosyl-AMP cyclohydrolase/phosphoribosyl-ATP diphosphatase HisIE n=1 Tax=Butyrivibrio sp. MC2021 TaxID=1408306 RepID=UPI00047A1F24|nr:bifunctional phosphoribosyl-AMP cyclohydrolase/phosphoribosyl-ATP diphosphatase HisIE [Butyrivibrio sp. MC2021]
MSFKKRFIPCIYLKDGKAMSDFDSDVCLFESAVEAAEKYSNNGADEILVFDLSQAGNDKAHEAALDVLKDICKASDVPVIGAGNVKRMEDIKKLLYAGCKRACLDYSDGLNVEITEEVSDKFGKDKILITYRQKADILSNKEKAEKYCEELVCLSGKEDEIVSDTDLPVIIFADADFTGEVTGLLTDERLSGISGPFISENSDKIDGYKTECLSKNIPIDVLEPEFSFADLKKNSDGMVPVIVQDYRTDQVLMLAYMNEEAYNNTLKTGKMTYFSRSRNELWLKGETSGHFQYVKSLYADCDLDTILAKVKQIGAACHTGSYSCFYNEIASKQYSEKNPQKVLDSVYEVIKDRKVNPRQGSYTNYLFDKGIDKILKKVGEEATEMVIAAKNPNDNEVVYEMSDFLYHMMVLMAEKNVSWEDITDELSRR